MDIIIQYSAFSDGFLASWKMHLSSLKNFHALIVYFSLAVNTVAIVSIYHIQFIYQIIY